jgi:prophage tail gpP-like protein
LNEEVELQIASRIFTGWKALRITRELDRMASDFDLTAAGRWPGQGEPIMPFMPVVLRLGGVVVLTGFVDVVAPTIEAKRHDVRIAGRSKTAQLIDCTPELKGSELRGATLDAAARALAAPFGVAVRAEAEMGEPFKSEAMLDHGETAYEAIERLARLRSVLATDAPDGALVLTRTGEARAKDSLVEGVNIEVGKVVLDGSKRFSRYIVQAQTPLAASMSSDGDGDLDDEDEEERPNAGVAVSVLGSADDADVPLYRPRIVKGEAAMTPAQARERAVWAANTARAKALQANITVKGWLQSDGKPWTVNTLVQVSAPTLLMEGEMLIAGVTYNMDDRSGRTTELTVGPPDAWTPKPPKVKKGKGSGTATSTAGAVDTWAGVGSIR